MIVQGQDFTTPGLSNIEVTNKAREYRKQLILAWEKFAGNANQINAENLREVRARVSLFLKEVEG
jgi:NAD dependent epimerase/dehydratase family enzyme